MGQTQEYKVDEKYTLSYFFQTWMAKNNVTVDFLVTEFQLNSYTAGTSENRVYRLTRGLAKPNPDELHFLLQKIGIPYKEYDQFMIIRQYHLRIAAGEKPEDLGDPPN